MIWNGHRRAGTVYREVHGEVEYDGLERDVEGERTLEVFLSIDLLLGNTCYKKRDIHFIKYKSRNAVMQIHFYSFFHRRLKVIPSEEVAMQHQLLVCDMRIDVPLKFKRKFTPYLKDWKKKMSNYFQEVFNLHVSGSAGVTDAATEDILNSVKTGLLRTTEEVYDTTQPHRWRREMTMRKGHCCQTESFQRLEDW